MSLKFLAKKKWHTSNLANVEQVWIAEQKSEQENKRLAEFQKQISEERQIQELRNLQVEHGQAVKTVDISMDWMYEGPASAQAAEMQKSAEDYLLGKIYKPKVEDRSDIHELQSAPSAAGALWLNKISTKNDSFTRLHEDPLLAIKQREKQSRESVLNNPVKMARIRNQISSQLEEEERARQAAKEAKRDKKAAKKEEKKHRKSEKHAKRDKERTLKSSSDKKKERDYSSDSDSGRGGGSRQPSASNSNSRPSRHDSSSSSESRGKERIKHDRYASERGRPVREREGERDRYERRPQEDHRNRNRSRSRSRSRDNDNKERGERDKRVGKSDTRHKPTSELIPGAGGAKYGLQSSSRPVDGQSTKSFLGPNPELLAKKAEKERLEQLAKHRPRENVKALSEEERVRRLREMELDALAHDESRLKRIVPKEKEASAEAEAVSAKGPEFIKSMRSEVYNSSAVSMEDRLRQNRHYTQKGDDTESSGFMKRS